MAGSGTCKVGMEFTADTNGKEIIMLEESTEEIKLGTLVMSIPLFVLLANYIQRKFLATPYWCHRVGIAFLVAATTGGVAMARDYVLDGLGPNQAKHQETEEDQESPFDSFRLSADEPGEAMG